MDFKIDSKQARAALNEIYNINIFFEIEAFLLEINSFGRTMVNFYLCNPLLSNNFFLPYKVKTILNPIEIA